VPGAPWIGSSDAQRSTDSAVIRKDQAIGQALPAHSTRAAITAHGESGGASMSPRAIATNRRVSRDELLEFVRPRHHVVLLTWRADGSPQLSPVTAGVDGAGRIVVSTYPERAKVVNLRRRPEASVLVLSDSFSGAWVQVDGDAEVLDLPAALEPLVDYYRCISGEHSDWDEYRRAMVAQGKSLIRIVPRRWGPVATGGFPARLADS
jgi:PPOX class probable F420-dependent enzyme